MKPATGNELHQLDGFLGGTPEIEPSRLAELLEMKVDQPFMLMVRREISDTRSMGFFVKAYAVHEDRIVEIDIPGRFVRPDSGTAVYGVMKEVVDSPDGRVREAVFMPVIDGQPSQDIFCTFPVDLLTGPANVLWINFADTVNLREQISS